MSCETLGPSADGNPDGPFPQRLRILHVSVLLSTRSVGLNLQKQFMGPAFCFQSSLYLMSKEPTTQPRANLRIFLGLPVTSGKGELI